MTGEVNDYELGKRLKIYLVNSTVELQICPGLNANEIQIPCDKHHKVSSLVKSHQNTHLRSILDISEMLFKLTVLCCVFEMNGCNGVKTAKETPSILVVFFSRFISGP